MYIHPFILCLIFIYVAFTSFQIGRGLFSKKRTDGELIVDTSDPEKDIYRLELDDELETLSEKKVISLKIVHIQTLDSFIQHR